MANYEIVKPTDISGFGTNNISVVLVKPGIPFVAAIVVTASACLTHIYLKIGQSKQPIRINTQGVGWVAPRDIVTGRVVPEMDGLIITADDVGGIAGDFAAAEIYIEKLTHEEV